MNETRSNGDTGGLSLVLASGSPRRRRLLSLMGLSFETTAPDVDESARAGEEPEELARRLSLLKARTGADGRAGAVIIAADTLVVHNGKVLGKPVDASEAEEMLLELGGGEHTVLSGVALFNAECDRRVVRVVETLVHMREYTEAEIRRYVASGEPMDKAGAYAIQDPDFSPVASIEGCYTNVVGLPLCQLYRMLSSWGVKAPIRPLTCCSMSLETGCSVSQGM